MTQLKYNNLTLISEPYSIKQGLTTRKAVNCQCNCGEILEKVILSKLKDNTIKSCKNCSFKNRELNRKQVTQIDQIFKRLIIERCKKNNIELNITLKDYVKITKENCYYCGNPPQKTNRFLNRKYVNTEDLYLNGIDRLDVNKGYDLNNCVPCCTSCNYAKHILSEKDFILKIIKIYKNMDLENYKNITECVLDS
jgi:hypothetical protein